MNRLETLSALAEEATKGPWNGEEFDASDANREFIVAAVNALPDLLAVARAMGPVLDLFKTQKAVCLVSEDWDGQGDPLDAVSNADAALEPLLREESES